MKKNSSAAIVAREKRLAAVERLMLRGGHLTTISVGAAMGVTQQQASLDMRTIRERWREDQRNQIAEKRALRVRQLETLAQMAINGYDLSRKGSDEQAELYKACHNCIDGVTDEGDECPRCSGQGRLSHVSVKVKGDPAGDPAFLKVAESCIKECARIEGVYAEKRVRAKVKVSGAVGHFAATEGSPDVPDDLLIGALSAVRKLGEYRRQQVIDSVRAEEEDDGETDGADS